MKKKTYWPYWILLVHFKKIKKLSKLKSILLKEIFEFSTYFVGDFWVLSTFYFINLKQFENSKIC